MTEVTTNRIGYVHVSKSVPDLSAPGTGIPEAPTARGSPDRMLSKSRNVRKLCNLKLGS